MSTKDLFRALEFAHYANRYRDRIFVVALHGDVPFQELLPDIKVLAGYHIQVVLVAPDPADHLASLVTLANKRGTRLKLIAEPRQTAAEEPDPARLLAALANRETPLLAFKPTPSTPVEAAYLLAEKVARRLGANKLFLVRPSLEELVPLFPRSHITLEELVHCRPKLTGPNGRLEPLLAFIRETLEHNPADIVLLEGKTPRLFEEVFTYDGSGLLFTKTKSTRIRPARLEDITDMMMLLKPEIAAGRILPVEESEVESGLDFYRVYEVEGDLVGLARLKQYGTWAELSRFATLHRYRGRGRARELAVRLIEEAIQQKMDAVFALSVDPRMWTFFNSLGFVETSRENLPGSWKTGYDFSRPSKAFVKELT